ncbi:MAG: hypothetical protein CVT63_03185 [Candidatus Anoxymicrobium japonicum]|uniref:Alpha-galactosidase n=1 Tax=Candidatus Anoxymicrobium japonicum TaxID=2013648 RepID=A0A2N3G6P1_9ACTN|nr:MAG: hypothetical protein CVT63_03185 [Candidatus Anoxymicrobium japonicum]
MYEIESRASSGSARARLEFKAFTGTFDLYAGEIVVFAGASAGALKTVKKGASERLDTPGAWERAGDDGGSTLDLFKQEKWGRVLFRVEARTSGTLVLRVGLVWESEDEPPPVEALVPLRVPPGGIWPGRESVKNWRAYVHGWQCWSPTGALKAERPGNQLLLCFLPRRLKSMLWNPTTPVSSKRGKFESEWFTALADTCARDSVVVGFTGVTQASSRMSVRLGRKPEQSKLEAIALFDGKRPTPGEVMWSEPLAFVPGDLTSANFERYAEMLALEQGVSEVRRTPAGWCSWYNYFNKVTADDVLENLEMLNGAQCKKGSDPFLHDGELAKIGIDVVQIDDGYSPAIGDWLETNESFSAGMETVAQKIAAKGKIPGIWVAPFTVTRKSRIFKEHKDWVQRDRKGKPVLAGFNPVWKGRFYGLDLTNPEVLDWLREVFGTLARYGYRFFKLDFMAGGFLEGKRHDSTLTRAEAGRRALAAIRESVGKDAYIMAAGGPVLLGIGILDSQRVSSDVAHYWREAYQPFLRERVSLGVRNSLRNTLPRAFLSGRVFDGDPDCLMARSTGTKLTGTERRTLASVIAVFGGSFMLSDDLSKWGDEGFSLVAKSLPHAHGLPICPDLWEREIPRFLVSKMNDPAGEYRLALAINWSAKRRDMRVSLRELGLEDGRWHACEFWSGQYLREVTEDVSLPGIEPHGCALLRFTKASESARLIGSNINLSQGAAELVAFERTAAGVSLSLRSPIKCEAVLTLSLPGAAEIKVTAVSGTTVRVEKLMTAIYKVKFDIDGEERLEVSKSGAS